MWWAEAGTLSGQGGLVTFGTIRAVGGPVLVYEPQPTDRLVVALLDGSRREFYYLGANGNLAAPGLFFETDYDLDVRVVVVMDYDLRFVSQRRGVDLVHQMTGTISVADNSFEVDLNANERIVSDLAGDYRTQDTVRGALRAPGIDVQVQDDGEFRSVSAPRPVNPRTVTTFRRLSASSFTVNGSRFEFRGADLYRILANDQPIEPDSWVARGELLRQGAVVGRIDRAFAGATLIAQLLLGGQVFDLLRGSF